jgi:CSLREA domain-containing protein
MPRNHLKALVLLAALMLVPVVPVQAQFGFRVVAQNGQEIPESGGAQYNNAAMGVGLSNTGRILFGANLGAPGVLHAFRYVLEENGALRLFAPATPTVIDLEPGVAFGHDEWTRAFMSAEGRVALYSRLSGPGVVTEALPGGPPPNDRAIAVEDGGALRILYREGAWARENYAGSENHVAPERPLEKAVVSGAHIAFSDRLALYTPDFVSAFGAHVVAGELPQPLREIYFFLDRSTDPPLPHLPAFDREILPNGNVALSPRGHVAFALSGERRNPTQRITAVYRDRGTAPELLWSGEITRIGIQIGSSLRINDAGAVAFQWYQDQVWYCPSASACRLAAEAGMAAPGSDAVFSSFAGLALTDDDRLVITATLADQRRGIWMEQDGTWRKVVLQGDPAPGTTEGALFGSIGSAAVNNAGQVVFTAELVNTTEENFNNRDGVWVGDGETNVLVVRRGEMFDFGSGGLHRIETINVPDSPFSFGGGVWGTIAGPVTERMSHFNDLGELVFELRLRGATPMETHFALVHASRSLIVNSTGDAPDNDPGDGKCDTGGAPVNGRPECTLRAAIMEANAREGKDRITYDIPGDPPYMIQPESPLPEITDPVDIIGPTMEGIIAKQQQETLPAVVIDGSKAGATANGKVFESASHGSSVQNLTITNFRESGIVIAVEGVTVRGCFIGLNQDMTAAGNHQNGIHIRNARNVVVGGNRFRDGSTIAHNGVGVRISGQRAEGNRIQGNHIVENNAEGIVIRDAPRNLVGGGEEAVGNLISANKADGILIAGENATGNRVEGNHIGTNFPGVAAWANRAYGIRIQNAPQNRIGGNRSAGLGNVIAGNDRGGILIEGGLAGRNEIQGNLIGLAAGGIDFIRTDFPEQFKAGDEARTGIHIRFAADNLIGGAVTEEGNRIGGDVYGIVLTGEDTQRNRITGNMISGKGLNGLIGIYLGDLASGNEIGGLTDMPGTPPGNELEFHRHSNIHIGAGSSANLVRGNLMTGDLVMVSGREFYYPDHGIYISGNENLIGGTDARSRNVLYKSGDANIAIAGSFNRIQGNHIGVDNQGEFVDTEATIHNIRGIWILNGAAGNVIGGEVTRPGQAPGNMISGHAFANIVVRGDRTVIAGNFIGPSAGGQIWRGPNVMGIGTMHGIAIGSAENRIGGGPGLENIVSGNEIGILVRGEGAVRSIISGNRIGTGPTGSESWGNRVAGIALENQARDNSIGSVTIGNVIVHNMVGVSLENSVRNSIQSNAITANTTAVRARGADRDFLGNNKILLNSVGIDAQNSNLIIAPNEIPDGQGLQSGIHLSGGRARIYGNLITRDAGDAIVLENDAEAHIERNNIFGNTGFGLLSLNSSGTIVARDNWWGHPSGPAGNGSGSGDRVSTGVDFSNWRTSMVALVAVVSPDTLYVTAGAEVSAIAFFRNWAHPNESIDVSLSDERDWLQNGGTSRVDLGEDFGGSTGITVSVPPGTPAVTINSVTVTATSQTDPAIEETRTLVVAVYEAALHRIAVGPDTAQLLPGQSEQFAATGFDQQNRSFTFATAWSATGGTITEDGLYTAGETLGEYVVTASDGISGISASAVVHIVETVSTEPDTALPAAFALHAGYPNPFNPTTTIPFDLPRHARVVLKVYDILGREVATLIDSELAAGHHAVPFDASGLPSGMYLYAIRAGDFRAARKMILVK